MAGFSVGKARTWCSRVNRHIYKNGPATRRLSGGSGDRLQEALFDLCRRRHFITGDKLTEGSLLRGSHSLGPLGKELQKNLVNGWWDSVVLRRDDVLAIDSPHHVPPQTTSGTPLKTIWGDSRRSRLQTGDLTKERPVPSLLDGESPRWTLRGDLLYGALQQYVPCLDLMNKRLPFGVAEIGKCFHPVPGETDSAELSGIGERTAASLTWFSAAKTAGRWRDYWLRQRLLWWQKFAQSPSRFSAMEQPEGHRWTTRIYYHFPWGKEPIESVCSMDDSALLQMHPGSTKLHGRDGRKSVSPHVVWVSGDLERGVVAYLSDALQPAENLSPQSKDRRREVLKLHPSLAPVKVAVDMGKGPAVDLSLVCQGMSDELRGSGISVWPGYLESLQTPVEKVFAKYDEMGILFTVLVSENTLENGLLLLRSRDTTLKETTHVSKVCRFLEQYIVAAKNL